ncbi:hypothetical protein KW787_00510 [Candidatus Pacearchaeota archaeon]|nr:hypothetical protein [Candidatus Pacearchaeota archaeon]
MELLNKKGSVGEIIKDNVVYLIITALVVLMIGSYLYVQNNGAGIWGSFYAQEIVSIVNQAQVGDSITIDVGRATRIAKRNGVPFESIFSVIPASNELCISLSTSGKNCLSYFNNVVPEVKLDLGVPGNLLTINVRTR